MGVGVTVGLGMGVGDPCGRKIMGVGTGVGTRIRAGRGVVAGSGGLVGAGRGVEFAWVVREGVSAAAAWAPVGAAGTGVGVESLEQAIPKKITRPRLAIPARTPVAFMMPNGLAPPFFASFGRPAGVPD